jgi:hypothetical protein
MTEKLAHQLRGLALSSAPNHLDPFHASSNNNGPLPTKSSSSASGSRPPVQMKKFMNPIPQRQQNPYAESQKAAMMRLAGVPAERLPLGNSNAGNPSGVGSPARIHPKGVHAAHGVHGPAHSSTARIMTSTLGPQKKVANASSALGASTKDGRELSKYEGGGHRDENTPVGISGNGAGLANAQRADRVEGVQKQHAQGLRDEGVAIRVNEGLDITKLPEGDIGSMLNKK